MIIKRHLQTVLEDFLRPGKVNVLLGSRRVGKTFLLREIKHKFPENKVLWYNAEDKDVQDLLANRSIANYNRIFSEIEVLIIDEAQVIPEIGKILKLIVDELPWLKIIITGSSAFELNNSIGEPLVGRAFWHELYPITQSELIPYENALQTKQNLEDRLIYGSYPELFQLEKYSEKQRYLQEIVQSYLLKDILAFDGIRNAGKIQNLLRLIAHQMGKEVSLEELGRQLQMSKNTVEKYLDLLTKVFILKKTTGFSKNLRKEISKSSRWHFWDNGIRNGLLNNFNPLALRQDVGELWENYFLMERIKHLTYNQRQVDFYFWRTYDQQEIDLIEQENQTLRAFEIKWTKSKAKAPKVFSEAYPEASFEIVTPENYLDFII